MAREAQIRINHGARSIISKLAEGESCNINAKIISEAAVNGDPLALEIIAKAAEYLGRGMVNLVNIFNPEMIVVGGGVSKMGDMLLEPARKIVAEKAFSLPAQAVRIVPSQLGDNAAAIGGAAYIFSQNT
jgi:glucokinase